MDDKQTCDLGINIGGMAFAFCLFFLFLEGGGGWEKGVQPLLFYSAQSSSNQKKNVNYDTKEIVHEHSPSLSSWKKFFYFYFFRRQRS